MSSVKPSPIEFATAVTIESVTIHTEIAPPVEIAAAVTDIDVFEHIDKPYLTAVVGFVDFEDVVGLLNLSGGEKVIIELKANVEEAYPVVNKFYIDKIMSSTKVSDNEEFFTLHLIEDIGFESNLMNVNKPYTGKSTEIIKTIAKDFLGAEVDIKANDVQDMKVIVPNLTPIDAMCWVKNRSTTFEGYPIYLYSTLVDNSLQVSDLQTLLTERSMNPEEGQEYTHYESQVNLGIDKMGRRVIKGYQSKDTYDVYKLIDLGLLGAEHQYLDITKKEGDNRNYNFILDFDMDVIKNTLEKDTSLTEKTKLIFDKSRHDWSSGDSKINSRKITRIGSANVFNNKKSISQGEDVPAYKRNEISRTISQLLTTDPITFVVNGIDFFSGIKSATIGNKLTIKFLRNTKAGDPQELFDFKKSGDYIIFACKHSFTTTDYTLTFSGVKMYTSGVS